jgi:spermidine synthase
MIEIRLAMLIAALSGFVALSYEILWYRAFSLATGGTAPIFAFVLGAYLYGLAAGSFLARAISRRIRPQSHALGTAVGSFILGANAAGFLVLPAAALACSQGQCLAALPGVAIAAGLLGAVLPLACHAAIPPDDRVGIGLSRVYAANIVGSVGGTLLTGYILLEYLPMRNVAVVLLLVGTLVAALPVINQVARPGWVTAWAAVLIAGALLLIASTRPVFDTLFERLIYRDNYRQDVRFARSVENRAGVINIMPSGRVFGGGVYDGYARVDLVHDPNLLSRIAAVPAFHQPPRRVLMIGLSMGAWAQVVANMPSVESLTIVEINPGYLRLIPEYPQVASLLDNPKVKIVVDDGRRWLLRNPAEKFDLIVANVTFHWREHATNLLSLEFMQLVRAHLVAGGAYFYNATFSPEAYRTGLTSFRYGLRVVGFLAVSDRPLIFRPDVFASTLSTIRVDGRPLLDPRIPAERMRLEELTAAMTRPGTPESPAVFEDGAALLARLGEGPVVTDDNMAVEWRVLSGYTEEPQ